MRGLKVAIGIMTVMIVAGVAVIGVTIVRRVGVGPVPVVNHVLDEPVGTRIVGIASAPEGLTLLLQGGGADRVVRLDPKTGQAAVLATLRR